ncbi:hypothetical protein HanXRQr2_Chr04g0147891 [Helianthus annuus]|uniref:Uncharacterized protein n=1 Tax=Helianthus annuus TaxID=4232 RepID=A0A9K3NRB6_HELAN|nr:hypothetical protein HanXRQr2_Chr04g0147891 [Helianthus annuus]
MGWWMATCCDGCNGGWQRCSEQPHSRSMANSKLQEDNRSNSHLSVSLKSPVMLPASSIKLYYILPSRHIHLVTGLFGVDLVINI